MFVGPEEALPAAQGCDAVVLTGPGVADTWAGEADKYGAVVLTAGRTSEGAGVYATAGLGAVTLRIRPDGRIDVEGFRVE